jgi:membrane protease YdiL (CAAX protease family)
VVTSGRLRRSRQEQGGGTTAALAPSQRSATSSSEPPPAFDAKPLLAFFLLAYGISWGWVIALAVTGQTVVQGDGWPTHFPSLLGPLIAAFIVTGWTAGRQGTRQLVDRMRRWRIGARWWLAAVSPLLFFVTALTVMGVTGNAPPRGDFARFSGLPAAIGIAGVAVAVVVVNGFGEEAGWRGYALPQLEQRFGPVAASLVLAVLWAGWHLPQFFVLDSYEDFSAGMIPVFFFGLACGSVVCTWLMNRTGSVLAVVVWHGMYNLTGATAAASGGSGALAAAMWTFVVAEALLLLLLERRARRAGRPRVLGSAPLP